MIEDPVFTPGVGDPQEIIDDLIANIRGPYWLNYAARCDYFFFGVAAFIAAPECHPWIGNFDEYPQVFEYCIEAELKVRWPEIKFTPRELLKLDQPWIKTQITRTYYVTRRRLLAEELARAAADPVFTPGAADATAHVVIGLICQPACGRALLRHRKKSQADRMETTYGPSLRRGEGYRVRGHA